MGLNHLMTCTYSADDLRPLMVHIPGVALETGKIFIMTTRLIIRVFLLLRKLSHTYCTKMYPMALMYLSPLSV